MGRTVSEIFDRRNTIAPPLNTANHPTRGITVLTEADLPANISEERRNSYIFIGDEGSVVEREDQPVDGFVGSKQDLDI